MRMGTGFLLLTVLLALSAPSAWTEEESPGGLVLAVAVMPRSAESGTPVTLTATFLNDAHETLEILLPEHLPAVVFPRWELVHENGTVYLPHQPSFQSMWGRGLMGSILSLEPGTSKSFSRQVSHVVARVPDGRRSHGEQPTILLPAGRYTVRAAYVQKDDSVPWALPNFRQETRCHEGLWTGRVEADGVPLVVAPSSKPTIAITAPQVCVPGEPYAVRVEIRHAGPEDLRVRGALTLRAWSKAYGGGEARILLRNDAAVPATWSGAVDEVTFEARKSRVVEVDLASEDLRRQRHGKDVVGGLEEWIPVGAFRLRAAYVVEGEEKPLASAGLSRYMAALEEGNLPNLKLRLEKAPGPASLVIPRIAVVLTNEGEVPVDVPANLTYPRHVFFSITRPGGAKDAHFVVSRTPTSDPGDLVRPDDPGPRARIDRSMAWDGDRWETPRPLNEQSFVRLAPGSSLRRIIGLWSLVDPPDDLYQGSWEVRAWWRNRVSGRRLGLAPPLAIGLVASEPLTVHGRIW